MKLTQQLLQTAVQNEDWHINYHFEQYNLHKAKKALLESEQDELQNMGELAYTANNVFHEAPNVHKQAF